MSEHTTCADCGKCRAVKVADTWCSDCGYWSCERGEDCADGDPAPEQELADDYERNDHQ